MKKKLVINKETIRNLESAELKQVAGGIPPPTAPVSCTEKPVCRTHPYCTWYPCDP